MLEKPNEKLRQSHLAEEEEDNLYMKRSFISEYKPKSKPNHRAQHPLKELHMVQKVPWS